MEGILCVLSDLVVPLQLLRSWSLMGNPEAQECSQRPRPLSRGNRTSLPAAGSWVSATPHLHAAGWALQVVSSEDVVFS